VDKGVAGHYLAGDEVQEDVDQGEAGYYLASDE